MRNAALAALLLVGACAGPRYWDEPVSCPADLDTLTRQLGQREWFATAEIAAVVAGLSATIAWPAATPYIIGGFIGLDVVDVASNYAVPSSAALRERRSYVAAVCHGVTP